MWCLVLLPGLGITELAGDAVTRGVWDPGRGVSASWAQGGCVVCVLLFGMRRNLTAVVWAVCSVRVYGDSWKEGWDLGSCSAPVGFLSFETCQSIKRVQERSLAVRRLHGFCCSCLGLAKGYLALGCLRSAFETEAGPSCAVACAGSLMK